MRERFKNPLLVAGVFIGLVSGSVGTALLVNNWEDELALVAGGMVVVGIVGGVCLWLFIMVNERWVERWVTREDHRRELSRVNEALRNKRDAPRIESPD